MPVWWNYDVWLDETPLNLEFLTEVFFFLIILGTRQLINHKKVKITFVYTIIKVLLKVLITKLR